MADAMTRAQKYLEKVSGAVSGSGGHDQTFRALSSIWRNFGNEISKDEFLALANKYNARCQPPWSEKELQHKIDDVLKKVKPNPAHKLMKQSINPPAAASAAADRTEAGKKKSKHVWQTKDEVEKALCGLKPVYNDDLALEFFRREYGLDLDDGFDWALFDYKGVPGVVYPFHDIKGNLCAVKFKSFQRNEEGKRIAFFLYSDGVPGFMLFPFTADDSAFVIVGGAEKLAAASMAGYPGLSTATGEKRIDDETLQSLISGEHPFLNGRKITRFILANDNDETGAKANQETAAALVDAGFPPEKIRIVQWANDAPKGYDLNDIFKERGVVGLREFLENAKPFDYDDLYNPFDDDKLSLLTPLQILSLPLREDDCLLGDRFISRGSLFVILGEGGIGKSRLLLELMIDLILGRNWLMFDTHCQSTKCLLFQDENSARRLRDDIIRLHLTEAQWYEVNKCLRIHTPLKDIDRDVSFDEGGKAIERMKAAVQVFRPDIVAFDPLADFFGGDDENKNDDMRDFCQKACEISRAGNMDAATIINHHARAGRTAMKGALGYERAAFGRGAKALYNKSRSVLNIVRGSETDENALVCIPAKCNDGKLPDRFAVRFDQHEGIYKPEYDFDWEQWEGSIEQTKKAGAPKKANISDVITVLAEAKNPMRHDNLRDKIIEQTGCGLTTAKDTIKSAVNLKRVVHNGELYQLP